MLTAFRNQKLDIATSRYAYICFIGVLHLHDTSFTMSSKVTQYNFGFPGERELP